MAQAAAADAIMIVSTRTGGVLRRRSAETWDVIETGSAGGVAIDPGNPRRIFVQARGAAWKVSEDAGATAFAELAFMTRPARPNAADARRWADARTAEDRASARVSRIALLAVPDSPLGTLRALGTDRVFYTDEQRLRAARGGPLSGWVTLPSATDPYDPERAGAPLREQDRVEGSVLAPVWGSRDRLYVLTTARVLFYERNPDDTWKAPDTLYNQTEARRNWKGKTPRGEIPAEAVRTSLAVHRAEQGKGTLYVGTSGPDGEQHLWWFDGASAWRPAGLPTQAAVHAIAVDPAHREVVYVGTDTGVWRGTGTFVAGQDPSWVWTLHSSGLPGASCVDLVVHSPPGGPRVLRAALAGRGVWEVALDGVLQGPEVYLRAHALDTRRAAAPPGGSANPLCPVRTQVPLDASPDIRVWRAPATAPPEPVEYVITARSDPYDVWRMLAGLRAAGEDVDPKQPWSPAAEAARAHRQAVLFPPPLLRTARQFWEALLAGNPLPYERTPPDHADLVAQLRDEPDRWPKGAHTSWSRAAIRRASLSPCTAATFGRSPSARCRLSCCAPHTGGITASMASPRCRQIGAIGCAPTWRWSVRGRERIRPGWPRPRGRTPTSPDHFAPSPGPSTRRIRRSSASTSRCWAAPGTSPAGCSLPWCWSTETWRRWSRPTSPRWSAPTAASRRARCARPP